MKKVMLLCSLMLTASFVFAQKKIPANEIKVPMKAESWTSKDGKIQFADRNGIPAMEISNPSDIATVKNVNFSNGTIEYDLEFVNGFANIYFRRESDDESEMFYLRDVVDNPNAMDAVQYAPIIKKVLMWDMYPDYQAAARFRKNEWTHVKLVVSGSQMVVYINDKTQPVLRVARLEGNTKQGGLAFTGQCFISNLVIKPNETEGLSAGEGIDPTYRDNRYIRNWHVTEPIALPRGQEPTGDNVPGITTTWKKITAERGGMINLTRLYGLNETRKYAWLRTTLNSKTEQTRRINFGFSEEAWVFVNENLTYADKNLYTQNIRKSPDGRLSVDNDSFEIKLRAGDNDILVAVADNFYGWGIIARLDNLDGITLGEYKPETIDKELEQYFGTYASKDMPLKITVSQKFNKMSVRPAGQAPILMDKSAEHVYKYDPYGVVLEFTPAQKKMVLKQGSESIEFFIEP